MDEYIKKEIVVDYLRNKLCSKCRDIEGWTPEECKHCLATEAICSIEMANAADVAPVVRGKWINHGSYQECSVCHEEQPGFDSYRFFCPNCGADMRKETNDE